MKMVNLDELISVVSDEGWDIDTIKYSDWIFIKEKRGLAERNQTNPKKILFNVVNGYFHIFEPLTEQTMPSMLNDPDYEPWYARILDFLYENCIDEEKER